MSSAAAQSYVGEQSAAKPDDRLAAFRGPDNVDPTPSGFTENLDPANPPADPPRAPAPAAEPPKDLDVMPPARVDSGRAAIARRAMEARQRREMGQPNAHPHAPVDPFSVPAGVNVDEDYIAGEDETLAAPPPREQAPAPAAPPPRQEQPRSYKLKVDRNEFDVSRDDLIRYAGLTPEEAANVPEPSLVRAAQLNIAAENRLAEARNESRAARQAAPGATPYPESEDNQRHATVQPNVPQPRQPAQDRKELIRQIQLGDEDEALQAWDELERQSKQQGQTVEQFQRTAQEIQAEAAAFARENPNIVATPHGSAAYRGILVEEAVQDLAKIPGMTRQEVAQLSANPELAIQAYTAARSKGFDVRPPREIFDAAAGKYREMLVPRVDPNPPPAVDVRREAKRGLVQQPAGSDVGFSNQVAQQQPRRKTSSEVIREIARARHQH